MCHMSLIKLGETAILEEEVKGKIILEIGACNVNGTLRPLFERFSPAKYIATDAREGNGVDIVHPAEKLDQLLKPNSVDYIVSTSTLEHIKYWRKALYNCKLLLAPGGHIIITTCSPGYPFHGHPNDYWRFTKHFFLQHFEDFTILRLEDDPQISGVIFKAIKPKTLTTTPKPLAKLPLPNRAPLPPNP